MLIIGDVCSVTMGVMTVPSSDLVRLLRWEDAGGTWQVTASRPGAVTLSLQRCDGGEEVDWLDSSAADVVEHVQRALAEDGAVDDDLPATPAPGTLEA